MKNKIVVPAMFVLILLAFTVTSVIAEDSDAGVPSITEVEQKLNDKTGKYYLFIRFDSELSGIGEARIIETSFSSVYNIEDQIDKSRLVFIIGDESYEPGTYTLRLSGGTELVDTFVIEGGSEEGSQSAIYIVIAVVLVVVVIAAVVLYKRNH